MRIAQQQAMGFPWTGQCPTARAIGVETKAPIIFGVTDHDHRRIAGRKGVEHRVHEFVTQSTILFFRRNCNRPDQYQRCFADGYRPALDAGGQCIAVENGERKVADNGHSLPQQICRAFVSIGAKCVIEQIFDFVRSDGGKW